MQKAKVEGMSDRSRDDNLPKFDRPWEKRVICDPQRRFYSRAPQEMLAIQMLANLFISLFEAFSKQNSCTDLNARFNRRKFEDYQTQVRENMP